MPNWYVSREAVKRASDITGRDKNPQIDSAIEAASRRVENDSRRFFLPKIETRLYRWPRIRNNDSEILWLDKDLLSVTTLQTKAQDASPTTIASADYFLEPNNYGPPYDRIEIDLSSTAAFESGDTPQRSISVAGVWGYSQATVTAGTVASGLASDAAATSMVCSDGSLIDVGDTLLIGTEQIFVRERTNAVSGAVLDGAITSGRAAVNVAVDDASLIKKGEVIQVDSERMLVDSISSNTLTVVRGIDATVLASHGDGTAVHVYRTLTIERPQNGTTAAVHANAVAITKYRPPFDISQLVSADAISNYHQELAGWARTAGPTDRRLKQQEFLQKPLEELRLRVVRSYKRARMAAI